MSPKHGGRIHRRADGRYVIELDDDERVRGLLDRFVTETGSKKAQNILANWRHERMNFVRIETSEYQRIRDEAKGG